jgi:predicted DCC family thiol-disulfide oxidoreductase YuxK
LWNGVGTEIMISLASEMTDSKGWHARGWLFYDAECDFCTRIAKFVAKPMRRQQLGVAPLQDPRVISLLGVSANELLLAVRYLAPDGKQHSGAEALVQLAREFWWARLLVWLAAVPGLMRILHSAYDWMARHRQCHAEVCVHRSIEPV